MPEQQTMLVLMVGSAGIIMVFLRSIKGASVINQPLTTHLVPHNVRTPP